MYESFSTRSRGGEVLAPADEPARRRGPRPRRGPHTLTQQAATLNTQPSPSTQRQRATAVDTRSGSIAKRTVSGPPLPGGPMVLLDAYHDQLRDAVRYATERGFARSWDEDGLPQVKVFVGPRDEHENPECLLVLRAQAAFDFAWRMYDWAMGQKRQAEQARDGSALVPWRPNARRRIAS